MQGIRNACPSGFERLHSARCRVGGLGERPCRRRRVVVARWLTKSPYSPAFEVRDTVNKYGRYADKTKTITLGDLIKFHGHFCGGLVESAGALKLAIRQPFLRRRRRPYRSSDCLQQLGMRRRCGRLSDGSAHTLRLPCARPQAHRERVRRAAGLDRQDGTGAGQARGLSDRGAGANAQDQVRQLQAEPTSICSRSCSGSMPRKSSRAR